MERNATIASAPSVSNFAWPYGCCSSGACAATREQEPHQVVECVDGRVRRVRQHAERAALDPCDRLCDDDGEVGGERDGEHAADAGVAGFADGVAGCGHLLRPAWVAGSGPRTRTR
jgi:hypothetical protein